MTFDTILGNLFAFVVGVSGTSLAFVIGFGMQLATLKADMKATKNDVAEIKAQVKTFKFVEPPCQFLGEVKTEVRLHAQRLDQIEARDG